MGRCAFVVTRRACVLIHGRRVGIEELLDVDHLIELNAAFVQRLRNVAAPPHRGGQHAALAMEVHDGEVAPGAGVKVGTEEKAQAADREVAGVDLEDRCGAVVLLDPYDAADDFRVPLTLVDTAVGRRLGEGPSALLVEQAYDLIPRGVG